ncbi:hypothetical protein A3H04_00435 [Candidatus Giovannonibacteria bacterium RIFCSPLOWO2_12_FULL_43_11c]|nr:MAG: hypothetical protein A3H04_00435 [Candidatus Giovannonibacteria bacterium RIFCSPLOWO2_12_FULL_43_11c]
MKIVDEIGQSKKIAWISPNHEQALSMMVDAYARLTGFGVGVVTSGPGGTNLITGIACAYYDSVPCLFITGQVGMFHVKGKRSVRQRGFQETDIFNLVKPITKYSVLLENPEDVRYEFEKAVYLAKSGRPGPVLIDVPYNVQREKINPDKLRRFSPPEKETPSNLDKIVSEVLYELKKAKKPLILAGGGVKTSFQDENLRKLTAKLNIPIATTWSATDIFPPSYRLYLGNVGRGGNHSAVKAIQESDLILGLGTRFTTKVIIDEKKFAKGTKIISVDADDGEMNESLVNISKKINIDLKDFLPALLKKAEKLSVKSWLDETALMKKNFKIDATRQYSQKYLSPYELINTLSDLLPDDAVIIPDCGCNLIWTVQAYKAKVGQSFFSAWGHSPMGYSFAASIGAWFARKKSPIIAIIGDGGMQMNIQELQTAVLNKIPVKVFVLNNRSYGNTKFAARDQFEGRSFGNEIGWGYEPPDYKKIAHAYGIKYMQIKNNKGLKDKLKAILKSRGPILADFNIDPEQYIFENTL